jgi:hypothetical protein
MVAEVMKQRGQGYQWWVEGNQTEEVDFDFCYPVVPTLNSQEVTIFLKQKKMTVRVSESWMNLSDRLIQQFELPRGALFRIYSVDGNIQRLGDDDHAYSFDWTKVRQYWFEIVHDHARDRHDFSREIQMVGGGGRVDSLVISGAANIENVKKLWNQRR